ncbi:MAG: thiamine biosynthesis protein ThiS [Thermoprotei archaeon]|nr:MAG: thiamine biosynthesis protein ThiS [Desulfurococcales archaeon ex4484_42]RLG86325.1 MAG: thiamine biosynthesis protein ThiS [Thermoprotei archaeon]
MVKVIILPNGDEVSIKFSRPVRLINVLKELGFNPEGVVALRGDELITEDDVVSDDDLLKLIKVRSFG